MNNPQLSAGKTHLTLIFLPALQIAINLRCQILWYFVYKKLNTLLTNFIVQDVYKFVQNVQSSVALFPLCRRAAMHSSRKRYCAPAVLIHGKGRNPTAV